MPFFFFYKFLLPTESPISDQKQEFYVSVMLEASPVAVNIKGKTQNASKH